MSTLYETHLEQIIKNKAQEISGLKFMNDQQSAKIAQLKESEDELHTELRAKEQRIAALLENERVQDDHIDDLAQQVKSLQAALDERDEELERRPVWPMLSEDEDSDTRTNQLINALYHDRARLEKALKHGAMLVDQYKQALLRNLGEGFKDNDGNEYPEVVYTSGLLSEWCHVNG